MPAERPIVETRPDVPEVFRDPRVQLLAAHYVLIQNRLSQHVLAGADSDLRDPEKSAIRGRFSEIAVAVYADGILDRAGGRYDASGALVERGRQQPLALFGKGSLIRGIDPDHSDGIHGLGRRAQSWRSQLEKGETPNDQPYYALTRFYLLDRAHFDWLAMGQDAADLYAQVGLTLALTSEIEPPTPASPTK